MNDKLPGIVGTDWYSCLSPELETFRNAARMAVYEHCTLLPDRRGPCGPKLRELFAALAPDAFVEAPFHCSYGVNITLGRAVYLNAGCTILDSAPVTIGDNSMLGPGVHIYCADHHRASEKRRAGIERALPVVIGRDVWIGGRAIILPGVAIGDHAVVAAGAVVSRDVAADTRVAGVPARAM